MAVGILTGNYWKNMLNNKECVKTFIKQNFITETKTITILKGQK